MIRDDVRPMDNRVPRQRRVVKPLVQSPSTRDRKVPRYGDETRTRRTLDECNWLSSEKMNRGLIGETKTTVR